MKIEGLEATVAALRALPRELSGKNGGPVRGALFAAAKVIKAEAQQRAPKKTGTLAANVITVRDRNPRLHGAAELYHVTVRGSRKVIGGKRRDRSPGLKLEFVGGAAWYWFFVEFGTSRQPGRPFLTPAFEVKKMEAVDVFVRELAKQVDRAVERAKKGAGR